MGRNFPADTPHAIARIKERRDYDQLLAQLRSPEYVKKWFDQIGDEAANEIENLWRERTFYKLLSEVPHDPSDDLGALKVPQPTTPYGDGYNQGIEDCIAAIKKAT